MTPSLPERMELHAAARVLSGTLPQTPHYSWPLLDELLAASVRVKHDNHLPVGTSQVRGALMHCHALVREQPFLRHIVYGGGGNRDQSLAFAAHRYGLQATIVVPRSMRSEKKAVLRALGGRVLEMGESPPDSAEHARRIAQEERLYPVPAFHRDFVLGMGAGWMELLVSHPELDYLFVPIGSGTMLCAAIAARNALGLHTRIVGVVIDRPTGTGIGFPETHSDGNALDAEHGHGSSALSPQAGDILARHVGRIVVVSHEAAESAMRQYYLATHNVASLAAGAGLAAALQCRETILGKRIGLLLCGGNVEHDVFARVLSTGGTSEHRVPDAAAAACNRLAEMAR